MNTEPFFITYANFSLLNHPEHIKVILDSAKNFVSLDAFGIWLENFTKKHINSPKRNGYDFLAELYIRYEKCQHFLPFSTTRYLMEVIGTPEKERECSYVWKCGLCKDRHRIISPELFTKINCVMCDQLYFQHVLCKIVEDYEYDQIEGFIRLIKRAEKIIKSSVNLVQSPEDTSFKFIIRQDTKLEIERIPSVMYFLQQISSFSLREFLLNNNRRRLKKCPYCNNFFIAKDAKRTTKCYSDICTKEYERIKKQKQREIDPVKYV